MSKPQRITPPRQQISAALPWCIVMLRNERAAIWADRFRVWPEGYVFWLTLALSAGLRTLDTDEDGFFLDWRAEAGVGDPANALSVRVQHKGASWSNHPQSPAEEISFLTGRDDGVLCEAQFWIPELPSGDNVSLKLYWPLGDVAGEALLDASDLRMAAVNAVDLLFEVEGGRTPIRRMT